VQINGKLVTVVRVAIDAAPKAIETAALSDEKVQSRTAGKTVSKVIVVPGKLVNLVLHPSDKGPSPGTPVLHPSDKGPSPGTPVVK
jgi:hypothetical protein